VVYSSHILKSGRLHSTVGVDKFGKTTTDYIHKSYKDISWEISTW